MVVYSSRVLRTTLRRCRQGQVASLVAGWSATFHHEQWPDPLLVVSVSYRVRTEIVCCAGPCGQGSLYRIAPLYYLLWALRGSICVKFTIYTIRHHNKSRLSSHFRMHPKETTTPK